MYLCKGDNRLSYKRNLVKQHDATDCAAACLATNVVNLRRILY